MEHSGVSDQSLNQFRSQLKNHSENNDHTQGYVYRAFTTVSRSSHGARSPILRGVGCYSRVGPSLVTVQTRGVDWQRNRWHWVSYDRRGGSWRRWWEVVIVTHVGGTAPWSTVDQCMALARESCVLYIANIIGIRLVANKVQTALLVQIQDFLATAFPDKQFHVKALIPAGCTCHGLEVSQTIVKRTVRWTLVAGKSLNWNQTNWSVHLSIIVRVLSATFAGKNAIFLSKAWARAHCTLYWLKRGWNDDFSPA